MVCLVSILIVVITFMNAGKSPTPGLPIRANIYHVTTL